MESLTLAHGYGISEHGIELWASGKRLLSSETAELVPGILAPRLSSETRPRPLARQKEGCEGLTFAGLRF